MSGVVLRCRTCGTTQNHTGECDACYEDQVRYFCGNHRPGLWLEGPVCNGCGATFGEAPERPPAPRSPTSRRTPATPPRPAPPRPTPARPVPEPDSRDREAPRTGRSPLPDPDVVPPGVTLADIIARAFAARRARETYRGHEAGWGRAPDIGAVRPRNRGCLLKALLVIFLLFAFVLGGPFILLSGFLQYFL